MEIFTAADVHRLLPYNDLAQTIGAVMRDRKAALAHAPDRMLVPLGEGDVLFAMPGADPALAVIKIITAHAGNSQRGLPVIQGQVIAIDATNGTWLFLLDGGAVTARRTAALSLLAAQVLAPQPDGPLLVVGAGVQGEAHIEAFTEALGTREIYLSSRTPEKALSLVERFSAAGLDIQHVLDPNSVLDRVSMIVTGTYSSTPVISGDVRDDTFIAAVGAYTPEMAELPPELVRRSVLYVDTPEGARREAGDLIGANVDWSTVTPLQDALDLPRPDTGPVIFKSVGEALWDLAAARLAAEKLGLLS